MFNNKWIPLYTYLLITLIFTSNSLYSQQDSTFFDKEFYYKITIPGGWKWQSTEDNNKSMRLFVTSPDEKKSLLILCFKSKKGNISIARLSNLIESDQNMLESFGQLKSSNKFKEGDFNVIEKKYEKRLLIKRLYTSADHYAKDKYGYIFIYSSELKDQTWQKQISDSLNFTFESKFVKRLRYITFSVILIFLLFSISKSAEPFVNKKSIWLGLISLSSLIKLRANNLKIINDINNLKDTIKKQQSKLTQTKKENDLLFNKYWESLQSYVKIEN